MQACSKSRLLAAISLILPLLLYVSATDNLSGHSTRIPSKEEFVVHASSLPKLPAGLPISYAGLLPISDDPNESRKLFFWYWEAETSISQDLIIWLQGGPGSSSLYGMVEENGPFVWNRFNLEPTLNPYSWHKLANIFFVEQPVGTGFSQGEVDIMTDVGMAQEFLGFFDQFRKVFTSTLDMKTYITGESWAGIYVPYIMDEMYKRQEAGQADYQTTGLLIIDGVIGEVWDSQELYVLPFIERYNQYMKLNETTIAEIREADSKCGFAEFRRTNLVYPAKVPIGKTSLNWPESPLECELYTTVIRAIRDWDKDGCFNQYSVSDTCNELFDPLDINGKDYDPNIYFANAEVQRALHVLPTKWTAGQIHNNVVYVGGIDDSATSISATLPRAIEKSERTIIAHGELDFLVPLDSNKLNIQQMRWGGKVGFDTEPSTLFYVDGKKSGIWHEERKLWFVQVFESGHEIPMYQPAVAYQLVKLLLGQIKTL